MPATVDTVAVPTDKMPCGESVMPTGRAGPTGSMPKVPPRATPMGSVVDRSNVLLPPTLSRGMVTFQACAAGGGDGCVLPEAGAAGGVAVPGAGAVGGEVAGAALEGVVLPATEVSTTLPPPQPVSVKI